MSAIYLPGIFRFEWLCPYCDSSGQGLMPDIHASGACEVTRKVPRMVPEVARAAQNAVVAILYGDTHFMDGGGI